MQYQIEDYPYFVDEQGNVFREGKSTPLKTVVHKDTGYLMVSLWKDNIPTTRYVHILVATYWVANPDPLTKKFVNHKNGIKTDPHKDNLEWTTRSENMLHAYALGLCSQAFKKVLTEDQADAALATILDGNTLTETAKALKVGLTTLHHYVNNSAERLGCIDALKQEYKHQKANRNRNSTAKLKIAVVQCEVDGTPIRCFRSAHEAARTLGIHSGNITNCLKGRANTCGGFRWIYK